MDDEGASAHALAAELAVQGVHQLVVLEVVARVVEHGEERIWWPAGRAAAPATHEVRSET